VCVCVTLQMSVRMTGCVGMVVRVRVLGVVREQLMGSSHPSHMPH